MYRDYLLEMSEITKGVNSHSPRWQLKYAFEKDSSACRFCHKYMSHKKLKEHTKRGSGCLKGYVYSFVKSADKLFFCYFGCATRY